MNARQPSENPLLEEDTLLSTGVMPGGLNYDPEV